MSRRRTNTKSRLATIYAALGERGFEPGSVARWDAEEIERNYEIVINCPMKFENILLACVAAEILAFQAPETVRGVMYLLVSCGWLPDTSDRSYNRIQRLLVRLREARVIPFDWIADNIRQTIKPSSWTGLGDFAETVRDAYRKDYWATLPEHVEIIVEKDTVGGRLIELAKEYDIRLHPLRGYSSTSFAYQISRYWPDISKPITVYYIGDHDPSGLDLERSIQEKAFEYNGVRPTWHRIAVKPEHFDEFNILPIKPKKQDSRYQKFVDRFGPECAEVEAIPANALRYMVRDAIENHIPTDSWERLQEIEKQEKATWHGFCDQIGGVR